MVGEDRELSRHGQFEVGHMKVQWIGVSSQGGEEPERGLASTKSQGYMVVSG